LFDFDNACREDFYFNGTTLGSFNGIVGGSSGFKRFSLLPSQEHITEKINGVDGAYFASSRFAPRAIIVPIFISDLSGGNMRALASWLAVREPKQFFWDGDTAYINCIPDQEAIDLEDVYYASGVTELKFIAYDPYFYEITPSNTTEVLTTGVNNIDIVGLGNVNSFPRLDITGSGTIYVSIINGGAVPYTCTITDVVGGVTIDTLEKRVYTGSTNMLDKMTGNFPEFISGDFVLRINGTVTNVDITPRFRWI